jgi:hypothetical protein
MYQCAHGLEVLTAVTSDKLTYNKQEPTVTILTHIQYEYMGVQSRPETGYFDLGGGAFLTSFKRLN